jgi:hypothetical protein
MVAYVYNLSTQEAKAGGSQVQGQTGLHSETLSQNKQTKKHKRLPGISSSSLGRRQLPQPTSLIQRQSAESLR